jgi:hypothetical protein
MHVEGDRCLQRGRRESAQSNARLGFGGRLLQQPHDFGARSARAAGGGKIERVGVDLREQVRVLFLGNSECEQLIVAAR